MIINSVNNNKIKELSKLNNTKYRKDADIFLVEGFHLVEEAYKNNLLKEVYRTIEAKDGQTALEMALKERPNLIMLDIMLPKMDGLTVCQRVKSVVNIPIIILTAKDEEVDKIVGLELGADDYITKPFSVRELVARVKANIRKADVTLGQKSNDEEDEEKPKIKTKKIRVGDLELDLDKFEVRVRGKIIDLTLREFEVLKFLASQPGQVTTREILLEKVWGYEYYGDIRTVDVTVRRIREKIETDTSAPKILITKRGVGYYIAAE